MTERPAILVVDDEKIIRKAYCQELQNAGYDAAAAASAADALSLLAQKKFAMVYVDVTLPDMNGIVLCRRIKECAPLTEVVLMSGRIDERQQLQAACTAAGGYAETLQKPLRGNELTDLCRRILGGDYATRKEAMSAKRILVVDDARILCVGLERILKQKGYIVECAPDGQAAVSRVQEQEFQLVLTDLIMPGLDGIESCRQIKQVRPQTVVVLMTGRVDQELEQREQAFRDAGGYARCMRKPFEAEDILGVIQEALGT